MERFKALEKEMKMKAFSKEGLIAQSKLDPAEKAKREMIDWIGNTNDELGRQIELTEAELEMLNTGKKKKGQGDRLGELESKNERRQWHITKLEVVQRMLENGQLQVEQVEGIQEDVKYFVETNNVSAPENNSATDSSIYHIPFNPRSSSSSLALLINELGLSQDEEFEEDEGIYDDLNLIDEEDFGVDAAGNDDTSNLDSASVADPLEPAPKTPAKDMGKDKDDPESKKRATPGSRTVSMSTSQPVITPSSVPAAAAAAASGSALVDDPPSPIAGRKIPLRKPTLEKPAITTTPSSHEKKTLESGGTPSTIAPMTTPVSTTTATPPAAKTLPPIRYAAAAAAAVASQIPVMPTVPALVPAEQPDIKREKIMSPTEIDRAQAAVVAGNTMPPLPMSESPVKDAGVVSVALPVDPALHSKTLSCQPADQVKTSRQEETGL